MIHGPIRDKALILVPIGDMELFHGPIGNKALIHQPMAGRHGFVTWTNKERRKWHKEN